MRATPPPAIDTPDWWSRLADSLDEMVWVWDTASGRMLHANTAFLLFLGVVSAPADARNVLLDMVAAEDQARMRTLRAQLPEADYHEEYRLELPERGGRPRRTARLRERALACTGTGGALWVTHIVRDISWQLDTTAQLNAEITRRTESELKYRKVVENVNEGILVTAAGRIVYANPKALDITGLDEVTAMSKPFTEFIHPQDRERVLANHMRRLRGEPVENYYHFRVIHTDGRVRWLEISAVMFEWQGSAATLNFLSDVTERLQAEEDMRNALARERELSELKSRFVAVASHEFRTPLAGILSSVELLDSYGARLPDKERHDLVGQIRNAVSRMNGMVDQVLLTSKLESGHFVFEPRPESIPDLLVQLSTEMERAHLQADRIAMRWEGLEGRYMVDAQLLRHILVNLLSNALKYSAPDSPVDCTASAGSDGVLVFRVQDRGIGIPADDLPRLFETFHRGANVGSIQGTGIGLHIVRECVNLHRGNIQVDSEPGRGTTFRVSLQAPAAQG